MNAAQHEWRSKTAVTRRWQVERHLGDGERLQPAPQSLQLRLIDAGADAAGIDQAPAGIVVGEQQGAEKGARAFWIGPADDDKFLAMKAFDLTPQAAIPRRVGRIGALRDDALERYRTGLLMERAPVSDPMIAVMQG